MLVSAPFSRAGHACSNTSPHLWSLSNSSSTYSGSFTASFFRYMLNRKAFITRRSTTHIENASLDHGASVATQTKRLFWNTQVTILAGWKTSEKSRVVSHSVAPGVALSGVPTCLLGRRTTGFCPSTIDGQVCTSTVSPLNLTKSRQSCHTQDGNMCPGSGYFLLGKPGRSPTRTEASLYGPCLVASVPATRVMVL